ncbi:Glu/Leu/Phe/Val dehydrogenase dimerization domain-containing protein [Bradyrhizobium sp. SZCCHNR2032]|uniref:Glu/Leu/Phe/Val dehydrogenase dimerization domain-containing protein n=1 Tax=Bradyrhizobium sp. SZCCHNR2032 TaxID=3057384 RepID=UPI00291707EE|nr:Glu/Leu/Phe/Val dehydrogenase dimerization domain-containing protein [Bradyrhizobium sp. SZCCHNR2032]
MVFSCDADEEVVFIFEPGCGLRAIMAEHGTELGPAISGCRLLPFADDGSGLKDVLQLSRGMAWKAAVADLPFGEAGAPLMVSDIKLGLVEKLWPCSVQRPFVPMRLPIHGEIRI